MRESAGDQGMTIAKAVQSLRDNTLQLNRRTLVVVDEAVMVGTDDLRQLLTAITEAGAKTVLVGDAHQLGQRKHLRHLPRFRVRSRQERTFNPPALSFAPPMAEAGD